MKALDLRVQRAVYGGGVSWMYLCMQIYCGHKIMSDFFVLFLFVGDVFSWVQFLVLLRWKFGVFWLGQEHSQTPNVTPPPLPTTPIPIHPTLSPLPTPTSTFLFKKYFKGDPSTIPGEGKGYERRKADEKLKVTKKLKARKKKKKEEEIWYDTFSFLNFRHACWWWWSLTVLLQD